jgi:hypothetical protein
LLMRGVPEHDAWLAAALADPAVKPVVLWPADDDGDGDDAGVKGEKPPTKQEVVTLTDLRRFMNDSRTPGHANAALASGDFGLQGDNNANRSLPNDGTSARRRGNQRVLLLAVDSTWRVARRMVQSLPPNVARLNLDAADVFTVDVEGESDAAAAKAAAEDRGGAAAAATAAAACGNRGATPPLPPQPPPPPRRLSLLHPLRPLGAVAEVSCVCTAEAVVGALRGLGLAAADGNHVLDVARAKVSRVLRSLEDEAQAEATTAFSVLQSNKKSPSRES